LKNRKLSPTILCAIVLSLAIIPGRLSVAQTDDADSSSIATTATAPEVTPNAVPLLTYTVKRGDTLTSIAHKFGLTLAQLKRMNNLPETKVGVKHGQVLQVVYVKGALSPAPTSTAATPPVVKKKGHSPNSETISAPTEYASAQPVQNFDVTANTAAAAEPDSNGNSQALASANAIKAKHASMAKLVSPQELSADEMRQKKAPANPATLANAPVIAEQMPMTSTVTVLVAPSSSSKHPQQRTVIGETTTSTAPAPITRLPQPATTNRISAPVVNNNPFYTAAPTDWGSRFLLQARQLGNEGIGYDDEWRPPGEGHSWAMDCSNTSRYIYKVTTGIDLPRTASDQYYYLHLQGKAWDVPQNAYGWADTNYLRGNLKPGDLLFWENTYRPERQPPITHVMIFLGTNAQGQWLMAGSQSSRGGEHNRRNGGPDVYIFRPSQACGGYTTWLGMVHHQGRFCAFGRPLEADRRKLSVADD
jgi:LysM repeat protein